MLSCKYMADLRSRSGDEILQVCCDGGMHLVVFSFLGEQREAYSSQTVKVTGEIRASTIDSAYNQIEQIRALNDGAARVLDLEDGTTPPFNAKLVDPEYALDVQDHWFEGKYHVPYMVTFLEVASPS